MRIAAGVLLIVAAIFNVIAGTGYAFVGAVGEVAADHDAIKAVGDELAKGGAKVDDATVDKATDDLKEVSGGLKYFGFFLLAMFILQIVCAVLLFIGKGKMFIFIVAALSVIAEVGGIVIVAFGWTNTFGLVGGILAFIGAMGIGKAAAAPPAAPEAPAA